MVEGDLGQEPLEAGPALDRLAALAQVVVDGGDAIGRPAEGDGAVGQGVLAGGGLLMVDHLLGRGLADVDEGRAVEVPGPELGRAEGVTHGRPPRCAWPPGAWRGAGRAGRGAAAAGRPGAGPRRSAWSPAGRVAVVRGGGERCVGRWRACGLSGWFDQVLSAPRGQFKQRGDADRNRRRGRSHHLSLEVESAWHVSTLQRRQYPWRMNSAETLGSVATRASSRHWPSGSRTSTTITGSVLHPRYQSTSRMTWSRSSRVVLGKTTVWTSAG